MQTYYTAHCLRSSGDSTDVISRRPGIGGDLAFAGLSRQRQKTSYNRIWMAMSTLSYELLVI